MGVSFSGLIVTTAILVSAICTAAIIVDLYQIHIFRHDSVYYIGHYLHKLKGEGRWINYLLFPYLKLIPGQAAVYLNILLFFSFCNIFIYKWTKDIVYSLLLSLLFIQIYPLYSEILWPATILPAFITLFFASLVVQRLPCLIFYSLFGLLFLGTLSSLYYLLPLLHLYLLNAPDIQTNIKTLLFKIIPAWAFGFIFGYLVASAMIYILSGQHGMIIDEWRNPHYIKNIHDLIHNTHISLSSLATHTSEILSGYWRPVALITALLVGLSGKYRHQHIPMILLSTAIVASHYVITLPVGIAIMERTVIANWVGVLAIALLIPSVEKWQQLLVLPIIALLTASFYYHNHRSLQWYSVITNRYYDDLLIASPRPPHHYSGLILQGSDNNIVRTTQILGSKLHLRKGAQEGLDNGFRWKPVAYEAGFRNVRFCDHEQGISCEQLIGHHTEPDNTISSGLYIVTGTTDDGYLLISINPDSLINN